MMKFGLKIPIDKKIEDTDSKERFCEKCGISENKVSISYTTGLCDKCFK